MRLERILIRSRRIAKDFTSAGALCVLLLSWQSLTTPANAQLSSAQQFPNNFTDNGVVPKGCLFEFPSTFPVSPAVFYDQSFSVRNSNGQRENVRIRAWREGCHEPGRSAIVVNIEPLGPTPVEYPSRMFFNSQVLDEPEPMSFGFLPKQAAWSHSKKGDIIIEYLLDSFTHGVSLVVDGRADNVPVSAYNSAGTLTIDFGNNQGVEISVPAYDAELDPPQYDSPPWNGRFSGQWTNEELPNSGLILQIAEVSKDSNVASAIWFTYKNGQPTWFVGANSFELGAHEIVFDLLELQGGQVLTEPGTFTEQDIATKTVGTMLLRTVNCNALEAEVDLSESGLGQESLELDRLVNVAGYGCDQTQ